MDEKLMVSVVCLTYNHENFIADAIESFLMQKIDFKIEILIYDDASTDRTADIIRKYESKYPDIIKPIYQTVNQYSKGVFVENFNLDRVQGKYVATCEGDDFWTDPYKLQKQVDYMENNSDCSMCVHAAVRVSSIKKKVVSNIRPSRKSKVLSIEEIIEGGGDLIATNSIIFSREKILDIPPFYYNSPIGDYPLVIHGALQGTVYYMDDNMSAYRVGVEGSWTEKQAASFERKKKNVESVEKMLDEINEYTNFQFNKVITQTKQRNKVCILLEQGKKKEAKQDQYIEQYKKLSFKRKASLQFKYQFPTLTRLLFIAKWKVIK